MVGPFADSMLSEEAWFLPTDTADNASSFLAILSTTGLALWFDIWRRRWCLLLCGVASLEILVLIGLEVL